MLLFYYLIFLIYLKCSVCVEQIVNETVYCTEINDRPIQSYNIYTGTQRQALASCAGCHVSHSLKCFQERRSGRNSRPKRQQNT